jgi:arginine-tRNA-protein transferase
VYFLYHESIHPFAPGKLSVLYEISLAIEENYKWWYPGYYIHSCPKMKYKIEYSPQYILDPDTLHWRRLDKAILDILGKDTYVSFAKGLEEALPNTSDSRSADSATASASHDAEMPAASDASPGNTDTDTDDEEVYGSLFKAKMPGIPSLSAMEKLNLDHIPLKIFPTGPLFETSDLAGWNRSSIRSTSSIRHSVAQLVAALGADLMDDICLDLVRQG